MENSKKLTFLDHYDGLVSMEQIRKVNLSSYIFHNNHPIDFQIHIAGEHVGIRNRVWITEEVVYLLLDG